MIWPEAGVLTLDAGMVNVLDQGHVALQYALRFVLISTGYVIKQDYRLRWQATVCTHIRD